jgi:drug/metabolite transporter (DMT)-like permease
MNQKSLRGSLLLLLGAMVWGAAFAAQRVGMDHMGPWAFNGIRMLLGGIVLSAVSAVLERNQKKEGKPNKEAVPAPDPKDQRRAGLLCGLLLFAASSLQQIGLVTTTAGKAGFITALYVVLVPVAGWLVFRKNPGRIIWIGVAVAVAALYLLCMPADGFELQQGDLLMLGCAVCFTGQILSVDRFSPRVSPVRLSRDMFLICGSMGLLLSLFTETITWSGIRGALPALLYAGILSGALAYTLQILGQRDVHHPAISSLIMCLESVFSVLGGALVLGERLSSREGIGCVIMFAAVVLAQISPLLRRRR